MWGIVPPTKHDSSAVRKYLWTKITVWRSDMDTIEIISTGSLPRVLPQVPQGLQEARTTGESSIVIDHRGSEPLIDSIHRSQGLNTECVYIDIYIYIHIIYIYIYILKFTQVYKYRYTYTCL